MNPTTLVQQFGEDIGYVFDDRAMNHPPRSRSSPTRPSRSTRTPTCWPTRTPTQQGSASCSRRARTARSARSSPTSPSCRGNREPTAGSCCPTTKADGAITVGTYVMATTDNSGSHTPGMAKALAGSRPVLGIALSTAADLEQVLVMLLGS